MGTDEDDVYRDLLRFKPEGMSPNRWALLAGVSRTVWSDMRRHGNPSRRTLEKLLTAAGSSLAEFEALRVGAERPSVAPSRHFAEPGAGAWRGKPLGDVPVVATAPAGLWGAREQAFERIALGAPEGASVARPRSLAGAARAYALTVVGDSMWPRFRPGRRVIVAPGEPVAIGDDVVVRLAGGDGLALLKELVLRSGSAIGLRQFNPDCTVMIDAGDVAAIEKVVGEAI